jgi:hypothetical protein
VRHPGVPELALYADGDLGFFSRLQATLHVSRCDLCRRELERFADARRELNAMAEELPEGLDWDRLAADMRANVRLGLEAGSIAGSVMGGRRQVQEPLGWRAAFVLAAGTAVIITGWFLRISPQDQATIAHAPPPAAGISIEATQSGVELKENGAAMKLRAPESEPVMLTVSAEGSVNARYVDSETGQVTINNVSFE